MWKNKYGFQLKLNRHLRIQICLPEKDYLSQHKYERTNMGAKCKICVTPFTLHNISILYRYICGYTFKSYRLKENYYAFQTKNK